MMNKKTVSSLFIGIFALTFLLGGCLQGNQVAKNYFALSVLRPGEVSLPENEAILKIQKLRVAPRYRERGFVYRTSDLSFERDFYNEFFIPPEELITENVRRWLEKSGLFQHIVNSLSRVEANYVLEGVVFSIYGDYRNPEAPKAVLGIEFYLINNVSAHSDIVFQKRYFRKVPLREKTTDGLVKSWNNGLKQILIEFEKDLREINISA